MEHIIPGKENIEEKLKKIINSHNCQPCHVFYGKPMRYFGTGEKILDFCDTYGLKHGKPYVYVLLCEKNKYYIGQTQAIQDRMYEHFLIKDGHKSSIWTGLYKPQNIVEIIELYDNDSSLYIETIITLLYMMYYGIPNARGGCFITPHTHDIIKQLESCMFIAKNHRPYPLQGFSGFNRYIRQMINDNRNRKYVDGIHNIKYNDLIQFLSEYERAVEKFENMDGQELTKCIPCDIIA